MSTFGSAAHSDFIKRHKNVAELKRLWPGLKSCEEEREDLDSLNLCHRSSWRVSTHGIRYLNGTLLTNPSQSRETRVKARHGLTSSRVKHPGNSVPVTVVMELAHNASALSSQTNRSPLPGASDSNAYLYIIIVVSFYGVFLIGIMLGYLRTKRREKRRSNVFTRLLHEEEQREWGASQKKNSLSVPAFPALRSTPVPFMLTTGRALEGGRVLAPLACALCSVEQSSVSSLSSVTDVRFAIEEESDSGGPEDQQRTGAGSTGENLKEALFPL